MAVNTYTYNGKSCVLEQNNDAFVPYSPNPVPQVEEEAPAVEEPVVEETPAEQPGSNDDTTPDPTPDPAPEV